jgi:hypothetical protein
MSIQAFRQAKGLTVDGSFDGLLMAAMRMADADNLPKLKIAYPEVWEELQKRNNAPYGCLTQTEAAWISEVLDIPPFDLESSKIVGVFTVIAKKEKEDGGCACGVCNCLSS